MKIALSTNWCNRRIEHGEAIVAKAMELGFDALELGFHTIDTQAAEILKCGKLPINSVHAFCPVPISAPCGYPELYTLASFDDETRAMARFQITKNIRFAASVGAKVLVLHAGRVKRTGFFAKRRVAKMTEILKGELGVLVGELEKNRIVLGLENMPYVEGLPGSDEIASVVGEWVKPWYDTGHGFVNSVTGWEQPIGVHVNDSVGGDDHLPPGEGKVDFKKLKPVIAAASWVVFEPNDGVEEAQLKKGLEWFRKLMEGAE